MAAVTMLDLTKANDMHFVYAAFAEDETWVYAKVGQSVKPFARIQNLITGCPFPLKKAVFCHAGSKKLAEGVEASVKHQLSAFRTRGEWYRFQRDQGSVFSTGVQVCFRRITGRDLIWTPMDVKEITRAGYEGISAKFRTKRKKPWETIG